MNDDK